MGKENRLPHSESRSPAIFWQEIDDFLERNREEITRETKLAIRIRSRAHSTDFEVENAILAIGYKWKGKALRAVLPPNIKETNKEKSERADHVLGLVRQIIYKIEKEFI